MTTHHHVAGGGAAWGMSRGLPFGVPCFVSVVGLTVGAGLGALCGKIGEADVDAQFQDQVRDVRKPGTSALYLVVERVSPDKAVAALSKYGGTVLESSLSENTEAKLRRKPSRPADAGRPHPGDARQPRRVAGMI